MKLEIQITEIAPLSQEEKQRIIEQNEKRILQYKNNKYEINRLAFESLKDLIHSEQSYRELNGKKSFQKFFASLKGKNKDVQDEIDKELAKEQYRAKYILEELAERNLLSFDLLTAIHNKLESSVVQVNSDYGQIYKVLVSFFKQVKSEIVQLENRVEILERNVELLKWQNAIEYHMFRGKEYYELTDIEKIVCITRDFYELTKGNWSTSDLLLLKTAMATIGLQPKEKINYEEFIRVVTKDQELYMKLIPQELLESKLETEWLIILSGIYKVKELEEDDNYVVANVLSLLDKHGVSVAQDEVKYGLLNEYEKSSAKVNLATQIPNYEFVLELLYNIQQAKQGQYMQLLAEKMKLARQLFLNYQMLEVKPMLEELTQYGFQEARYLLIWLHEDGYQGIKRDQNLYEQLLLDGLEEGDVLTAIHYMMFQCQDMKRRSDIYNMYFEELVELAKTGDIFAVYELGIVYMNPKKYHWVGEPDYAKAIQCFEYCDRQGYFRGSYSLAMRYEKGEGVKQDYARAFECFSKASSRGFSLAKHKTDTI